MRPRTRIMLVAFLLLAGAIVAFLLKNPQPRAALLFDGYRFDTNQAKRASFTLTNPASVAVNYGIFKETGGSNTLVIDGTLRRGQVISLQIPVAHTPARLMVHCHRLGQLRERLNDLRAIIGLRPATHSTADYTLKSEPFHE